MEGPNLYRVVRKGFSEKVTIEKHPEQCKGMLAEGIQRCDYMTCLKKSRMDTSHKYKATEQCSW